MRLSLLSWRWLISSVTAPCTGPNSILRCRMIHLKYEKTDLGTAAGSDDPRLQTGLQVQLLDEEGRSYGWVPRWADVITVLERASNTEGFSETADGPWLPRFGDAVQRVLQNANGSVHDARKIYGKLHAVEQGKVIISEELEDGGFTQHPFRPAFAIDVNWVESYLGEWGDFLIINGHLMKFTPR